jgi:archaemetzincin
VGAFDGPGLGAATIQVVPFLLADGDRLLSDLLPVLERIFHREVAIRPAWFDPATAFDSFRGQYHSSRLLELLLTAPPTAARLVGVTGVDLFIPVLTFVFGEAEVPGRAAVVSSYRLRNELVGLDPDAELLAGRLAKETVHELGHTFGLLHCHDPACVMRASTYVEEIDLKPATFCPGCLTAVRAAPPG